MGELICSNLIDAADIAKKLCRIAFDNPDEQTIDGCEEAVYYLEAIAENPYNSNHFRMFCNVLQEIANKDLENLYNMVD